MLIALQVVQFETAVGIPANCSVGKQPRRRGRINRFFIIPCIVLPVTERESQMGWGAGLDSINSSFIFFFYSEMLSPKQIHLCIFHLLFPPIAEKKTEVLIRFPPLSPRAMNEIPGGNVSMAG